MVTPPTGALTFLFTDIEGSTRLWEANPEAMRGVVERHDGLLNEAFDLHDGYVFSTAGDSFAAAFPSPRAAVEAALAAQQGIQAESFEVGDLRVRMGLHSGEAHERDGDYFGPALSRAARIMSAGHGGQVLLSRTTGELVDTQLPSNTALRSLGEFRLKDLGAPEYLFQLVHPDLEDDFPPPRTLDNHSNNLPAELSSFVGRRKELADIEGRLEDARLVTLTGVGGAGKTRLALQAAADTVDSFPDGVWVIELASVTDPEELPAMVVDVLGISGGAGETAAGSARIAADYLASRRALLILDNCEHLIGAAAELSDFLLRRCAELRILATSREGLGITGEHLIQVPSLTLPSSYEDEGEASRTDAVELFAERAAAVSSHFELNSENAADVIEICRRLDGMPLAIELAAARVRILPPSQIAGRLSDTFRLLTGGARTALPRQQTLRATIDWSYRLLSSQEKSVFARLALFRGGFTLEAAERIVSSEGVEELEVFELLASLVDKSMVQAADHRGRFGMLETLRQYAQDRLAETGQIDNWRLRHTEFYADSADVAYEATRDGRQAEWFERLKIDHENFKTAVTWAIEADHVQLAARIAIGLYWFWVAHSHVMFGEDTLTRLVEVDGLGPRDMALAFHARAWMRIIRHVGNGLDDAERARSISSHLDDHQLKARASVALIPVLGFLSRYDEEQTVFEQAYEAGRRAGDEWVMGRLALNHGFGFNLRASSSDDGYLDEADRWFRAALGHFRAAGVQLGQAHALTQRAVVRGSRGDAEGAIELLEEAGGLFGALGDIEGEADTELGLSETLTTHGRPQEAIDPALRGLALLREVGADTLMGHAFLAMARAESGDFAGGVRELGEAIEAIPKAEQAAVDRFCVYVARFATQARLYEEAANLMAYAGLREDDPTYVGHLSDTVTRRVVAELNEHLPGWSEVVVDSEDRPPAQVVQLIQSTLARLVLRK